MRSRVAILCLALCALVAAWIAAEHWRAGERPRPEPPASGIPAVARPAAAAAADPIRVYDVAAVEVLRNKNKFSKYRIRFSVQNLEATSQTVWANPFTTDFIPGGKSFLIPAGASQENLEVVAKMIAPARLVVSCGAYRTNCPLNW